MEDQNRQTGSEAKPQRQSQVNEQTSRLEGNLTTLQDSIGKLQDRLSAVLRSSVPSTAAASEDKDSVELVVLACTIEGSADSVRLATHRVEDILDKLEL